MSQRDNYSKNLGLDLLPNKSDVTVSTYNQLPMLPSSLEYFAKRDIKANNLISAADWRYAEFSYNLYAQTKYGEYVAKTIYYSVIELDLSRRLPNMLFDSKKARGKQFRMVVDSSQRQHLEGNFDKFFNTYFPIHYNIDSLSLISPEVMEALIQGSDYDIEIYGDKLYLFGSLNPPVLTKRMINSGLNIRNKLLNNSITYRDERLPSNIGRSRVSSYGIRLRENIWASSGVLLAGFLLLFWGLLPLLNSPKPGSPSGHFYYGMILITYSSFKIGMQKYKNYKQDMAYHKEYN